MWTAEELGRVAVGRHYRRVRWGPDPADPQGPRSAYLGELHEAVALGHYHHADQRVVISRCEDGLWHVWSLAAFASAFRPQAVPAARPNATGAARLTPAPPPIPGGSHDQIQSTSAGEAGQAPADGR